MKHHKLDGINLYDHEPKTENVKDEIIRGLTKKQKKLPCKLFYDEKGSLLYEQITELEEYYPTRTEISLLKKYGPEMASFIGHQSEIVELGSGSNKKIRILLDHLVEPAVYVPIDISREHLIHSATSIAKDYPQIEVNAICADFTQPFQLPPKTRPVQKPTAYYPGSTIGNLNKKEAVDIIRRTFDICGPNGNLLLGIALHQEKEILERAYNDDKEGVTADFNLNVLTHINREFDANFNLEYFRHKAFFVEKKSRIEMHLESLRDQKIRVGETSIPFKEGETIHTESSHKYTFENIRQIAKSAGLRVTKTWTDTQSLFSLQLLTNHT